jgi:ABC-type polar amino acid transport system ATPase subunit
MNLAPNGIDRTQPSPGDSAAEAVLDIVDLRKSHAGRKVLQGVSLRLTRGAVGALIGPSGGGKSTILRCINGLEPFESGSIEVRGTPGLSGRQNAGARIEALKRIRARVGMVFQQFNLFPHLSVIDNVTLGPINVLGRTAEQAREKGRQLLERVGLGNRLDDRPTKLSGGQQQRVAIARTLAMEPELILFDEPTSALDPVMTNEVLAVMTDLAAQGQTMLVVTHAMNFARKAASVVAVLAEGRIVESGPPAELFGTPTYEITREFLRQSRQE